MGLRLPISAQTAHSGPEAQGQKKQKQQSAEGYHLSRAPVAIHVAQPPQAYHEQSKENHPYQPYRITLRPAERQTQRPAGRGKEEVAN